MGRLVKGPGRLVPAAVMTAREQAAEIVAAAEASAASLRGTIDALRSEAESAGFAAGHQAGRDAALAEVTELLAAAREEADRTRVGARDAALALGRKMAERIVGRAVELSPDTIADIVAQALAASRARAGVLTLRVSALDLPAVEAARARLAAVAAGVQIHVVADPQIDRGGCIVETSVGRLDARLDTQLDALTKALASGGGGAR